METIQPGTKYDSRIGYCPESAYCTVHSTVLEFLNLDNVKIAEHYCNMQPDTDFDTLLQMLQNGGKMFQWAGVDLMPTMDEKGHAGITVIETNSCPAGNYGGIAYEGYEGEGYRRIIEEGFLPWLRNVDSKPGRSVADGELAVIYDLPKNKQECWIYAALMANNMKERVHLCCMSSIEGSAALKFEKDGLAFLKVEETWVPIRAAFKKVCEQPWKKIPFLSKTAFFNPLGACVAGGRNKSLANQAYKAFNDKHKSAGLQICTPWTVENVPKSKIPYYAELLHYWIVVKNPYSNAGLGVFFICSSEDLATFMATACPYDLYTVQASIAHPEWFAKHVKNGGTYPSPMLSPRTGNVPGETGQFLFDMRMMIISGPAGWRPACVFGRRPPCAVSAEPPSDGKSMASMLKTNVSVLKPDGTKTFNFKRLLPFGIADFPHLNLQLDDLIECFVQSTMAASAVDGMCQQLMHELPSMPATLSFDRKLFESLNPDNGLLKEMEHGLRIGMDGAESGSGEE